MNRRCINFKKERDQEDTEQMAGWSPEGYWSTGYETLDKGGDGQIGLARSYGEVKTLWRGVGQKKKKNSHPQGFY